MTSPVSTSTSDTAQARPENVIEDMAPSGQQKRAAMLEAYNASLTEKEFISGEKMAAWVNSWGTGNELPEPTPDIYRA